MKDKFGRPLRDLRISVTNTCNLECFYCHREGHYLSKDRMSPREIETIVRVSTTLGVKRIKVTGGEPLLRDDIEEIIYNVKNLKGIEEVSMVSNARLLDDERAERLKKAGLDRVNISLPSVNPPRYRLITGGTLEDAIRGLKAAVKADLNPVKLNMVLMKGLNEDDVGEAMDFARKKRVVLQLIELEPIGISDSDYETYHFSLDNLQEELENVALNVRVRKHMQARRVYQLPGVNVEIVKPIENTEFCQNCTRIRLTNDGKLKPCLMREDNLVDILTSLRHGASDDELKAIFERAIYLRKPYWRAI